MMKLKNWILRKLYSLKAKVRPLDAMEDIQLPINI